jgi:hypothetical protein
MNKHLMFSKKMLFALVIAFIAVLFLSYSRVSAVELSDEDTFTAASNLTKGYCFTPNSGGELEFQAGTLTWSRKSCLSIFQSSTNPNSFAAGYSAITPNGCYLASGYGELNPCSSPKPLFRAAGLLAISKIQESTGSTSTGTADEGQPVVTDPATTVGERTSESQESNETPQVTDKELAAQAAEIREKLSKGDNDCGGSKTVFDFGCDISTGNPITDLLFTLVKFLTYGIGLLLILSVVVSGFQYMTSQGNAQTTEKALKRIWNVVIALMLYIFGFTLLNYLVPGGLFNF